MEQFKKVQINIHLLDAIKQIPSYAKFLKDIYTNKMRFEEYEYVLLSYNVNGWQFLQPSLGEPHLSFEAISLSWRLLRLLLRLLFLILSFDLYVSSPL